MLWNGRTLILNAVLVSDRDRGNLAVQVGSRQFSLPHLALIEERVLQEARGSYAVLDHAWLDAHCPLPPVGGALTLLAQVRSVRDLSGVVLFVGRSSEGREVTLDQHTIHAAAGIEAESLGARAEPPAAEGRARRSSPR